VALFILDTVLGVEKPVLRLERLVIPDTAVFSPVPGENVGCAGLTGLVVIPVVAASFTAVPGEILTGDLDLSPT